MKHNKKRKSSGEGAERFNNEQEIWSTLSSMKKEIELLKQKIDNILPNVLELTKAVEALRRLFMAYKEETTRIIVSEIMKKFTPEVGAREPKRTSVPDMRMTEVKSNSAHFNGVPEAKQRENKKGNGTREVEKRLNIGVHDTVVSDCSISPLLTTKNAQKNKKKKRSPIPAPKSLRRTLKFNDRTNGSLLPKKDAGPFSVDATTPKEDIDLLDFIFMDRPKTDPDSSMTVIYTDDIFLSRTEMQCLRPGECISNFVMDKFIFFMNESDNVNWYFPSIFGLSCLQPRDPNVTYEKWQENLRKIAKLQQFEGRLANCERIFIPILERCVGFGDVGHWYLLIIHVKDRYAKILDSFPCGGEQRQRDARRMMFLANDLFEEEFKEADAPRMVGSLKFKDLEDFGPRQPNLYDCGLFVMRNMQKYRTDWAANYDSNSERARLVIELLRNVKNEVPDLQFNVNRILLRWRQNQDYEKYKKGKARSANKKHDGVSLVELSDSTTPKQV